MTQPVEDRMTAKSALSIPARLLAALGTLLAGGCAAMAPMDGVPVERIRNQLPCAVRSGQETIDLSRLRQRQPSEHLVDTGDVLGIFVETILGTLDADPPINPTDREDLKPTVGFPIPVRADGTISLPHTKPIYVRDLRLGQVEEAIRNAYMVETPLIRPGQDKIIVNLQRPRTYKVIVIRQESGNDVGTLTAGGVTNNSLSQEKRGTGQVVYLGAYENDVLHALARTGGLPGLDARNAIYVIRNRAPADEPVHSAPPSTEYLPEPPPWDLGRNPGHGGVRQMSFGVAEGELRPSHVGPSSIDLAEYYSGPEPDAEIPEIPEKH